MSKKLINSPISVVEDALAGLVACNPGLVLLEGHHVIVRSDIRQTITDGKVTILSGGGSGHEPAHGGYVGKGMLSAAVCGSVFASPPPGSILAGLRAIASPAGTLVVFQNYTGDRLNFGIAVERAKTEGIRVEMVIVGEDTAIPSSGRQSVGRRGLSGALFVTKIAGALAERGHSLDNILTAAQEVANSIATMSVCLSPCSIPGNKSSFELGADEMELGLGIHGEAGIKRTKVLPADSVVGHMINHMTSSKPGYCYFQPSPGEEVCLIVNNLGGTSNLELSIMVGSSIRYLRSKMNLNVSRVYTGTLMTSLEMAGVSISLLKVTNPQWKECLDQTTTAPSWPNQSLGPDSTAKLREPLLLKCKESIKPVTKVKPTMPQSTDEGKLIKSCVLRLCRALIEKEEELNELDRGCGDGDCGTTHKFGAEGIINNIDSIPWDTPPQTLLKLSELIEEYMGGTSGAIYSLFLTSASRVLEGDASRVSADNWLTALQAGINAITIYGRANVGDRTMVDSLIPACNTLKKELADFKDVCKTISEVVKAARTGAEQTKTMVAQAGRACYVDQSLLNGKTDPGAAAVVIWLEAIANEITAHNES